ncbi:MAG: alpha/beta hydrolase [Elusimicrobia bacterium]|nr:alpha/beta hydrolase [Elusimicrobiota bacterium]
MHWRQYQATQKVTEVGETFISYAERGAGAPLVLLHGMPTWGFLWNGLIPALERHRRMLIPDLPGFGYSDKSDRFPRSLSRQAEMLDAWLQSLGIERADFIGHDIGGGVALRLAAFDPARVGRLALLDTVCYDSWPTEFMARFGHPGTDRRLSAAAALKSLRAALRPGFSTLEEGLINGLLAPYTTETGKLSLIRDASGMDSSLTMELVPALPRINIPTLIVWGEQDPFASLRYGRRLAADLPKARLRVMSGARHFVHIDKPEEVALELENFLRSQ